MPRTTRTTGACPGNARQDRRGGCRAGAPGGVAAAVGAGHVGGGSAGGCEHEVDGGVALADLPVVLRSQGMPGVIGGNWVHG